MAIPFIQYLRPDGRQKSVSIERPKEVEDTARKCVAEGIVFCVEQLLSGQAALYAERGSSCIGLEVVPNDEAVLAAVDRLVNNAWQRLCAARPLKVRVGAGIMQVLQLDEEEMRPEGLELARAGKSNLILIGSPAVLEELADRCDDRTQPGWDQPAWYVRSARAAAKRIREVLKAAAEAQEGGST